MAQDIAGRRSDIPRTDRHTGKRPTNANDTEGIRLQKVLAAAGIGSRRACEVLIDEGRVQVDGKIVREQGMRVDPNTAVIRLDGERIEVRSDLIHLMLNKPIGVVSTMSDPEGRPSVGDYIPRDDARLFHVGRLDVETEGLLLLTNDGQLAHRLMHPSYEIPKTYLAQIDAPVPRDLGKRLRAGVQLDDGPANVDSFRVVDSAAGSAMVEVVVHEGRQRIVRRMFDEVGFPVKQLVRTKIGEVSLGDLRAGRVRPLTRRELASLYQAVDL
jgi:23S rRNA pseudouridine2605 synthase